MGSFVVRQPNGKLCRFSTVIDCPSHYNMTDEEYIELRADMAREEARFILEHHLRPYSWLDEYFRQGEMTEEEYQQIKKEMEE